MRTPIWLPPLGMGLSLGAFVLAIYLLFKVCSLWLAIVATAYLSFGLVLNVACFLLFTAWAWEKDFQLRQFRNSARQESGALELLPGTQKT